MKQGKFHSSKILLFCAPNLCSSKPIETVSSRLLSSSILFCEWAETEQIFTRMFSLKKWRLPYRFMTNFAYLKTSTMALDYFYSNLKSFLPVVCCEAWGKLRSIGRWPIWLGRGTEHSLISRCRRSWRSPSCRVSVKKYWWNFFAFSSLKRKLCGKNYLANVK